MLLIRLTLHPDIWTLQLNKANTSDTEAACLTCISQFLMILFLPKFVVNVTTLILKLSFSHF